MATVDMEDFVISCEKAREKYGKDIDIETIIQRAEESEAAYERMEHRCFALQRELIKRGVDLDSIMHEKGEKTGMKKNAEERKKYIAYGSNLNLEQMAKRCPTAKVAGRGEIKDYELLFRGHRESAVATVEPKKGASVPVLIWDIGPEDERRLDSYEGYPRLYGKAALEVQTENGCESIMAYTMNEGYDLGIPSMTYLDTITKGYLDAGFDVNILMKSVSHCRDLLRQEMEGMEENAWTQQPLQ